MCPPSASVRPVLVHFTSKAVHQKGRQACFFTAVDPMNIPMLTPRFEENEPRMIPYRTKWRSVEYRKLVRLGRDIIVSDHAPGNLAKVVKRNKDDSQSEILVQKKDQIREEVRHFRLKESPKAAQQAVGNHQRSDRPILKITPRIDQRIDGVF